MPALLGGNMPEDTTEELSREIESQRAAKLLNHKIAQSLNVVTAFA
jgi:hypothetical protein